MRAPDFTWNDLPVYRCRFCAYERVGGENAETVSTHEREQHQQALFRALMEQDENDRLSALLESEIAAEDTPQGDPAGGESAVSGEASDEPEGLEGLA